MSFLFPIPFNTFIIQTGSLVDVSTGDRFNQNSGFSAVPLVLRSP